MIKLNSGFACKSSRKENRLMGEFMLSHRLNLLASHALMQTSEKGRDGKAKCRQGRVQDAHYCSFFADVLYGQAQTVICRHFKLGNLLCELKKHLR